MVTIISKSIDYIKNHKYNIVCYLGIIVCSFIICGPFLVHHMTTDSYAMAIGINNGGLSFSGIPMYSISGRPISDFFLFYTNSIGFNMMDNQFFFNFLSIIIMIIATIMLYKICLKLKDNDKKFALLIAMASFLITFNMYGFEMFLFNVMISLSLQYLIIIYSVKILIDKFNFGNCFTAILLNFLGMCIYQGISPLFLGLGLILIGYKYRNEKFVNLIKRLFFVGFIYGVAGFLNIFYTKMLPVDRYSATSLFDNISSLISRQYNFWIETFEFLPKYGFILICFVLLLIAIFIIIKFNKSKIPNYLIILFGALACVIGASFLPNLISSVALVPRTAMIISSIPGFILLFIALFYENKKTNNVFLFSNYLIKIVVFVYLFLIAQASAMLMIELTLTNRIDKKISFEIKSVIEKYEKENNVVLKKMAFIEDKIPTYSNFSNRFVGMDSHIRAYRAPWSRISVMEYYTGRNFEPVNADEEMIEKYKDVDYNKFDINQIIIKDDIVYMIIY